MKSKESIFKHRIINNIIGFHFVVGICAIIISLGVSTKCNATISDSLYIYSDYTNSSQYKQYFEKDNYEWYEQDNPDYEKRYLYGKFEGNMKNSYGESIFFCWSQVIL